VDGHKLHNIPKMKQSLIWETRKRVLLPISSWGFLPAHLFSIIPKLVDQVKASQVAERAVLKHAASPDNCNAASVPPVS